MLAVSVKSICFPPYGKNLKNRFSDLCTEAVTLHMRFPYSVVSALFALPAESDEDLTRRRPRSTFARATRLLATVAGRETHAGPPEMFEGVTMLLFTPAGVPDRGPTVRLVDATTQRDLTEPEYFEALRSGYNLRNPHAAIGPDAIADEE